MIPPRTLVAIALTALSALTAGCPSGPNPAPRAQEAVNALAEARESVPARGEPAPQGDWLVRSLSAEPDTLNPITATDASESTVNATVYEALIERNPRTLEYEPRLAESWDVSEDHLTFTFRLRRDVRWHDGEPFTADDVIYTYDRIMDETVDAAPLRVYYQDTTYEKLDDYTVRCTYGKPYFLAFEFCGGLTVIPKHVFSRAERFNESEAGRRPIGTGPMKFARWETGQIIELIRNEDYYDADDHLFFNKIVFKIITDDAVSLQVFKEQAIDMVGLTPDQWVRQTSSKRFERLAHKFAPLGNGYNYVGWNMRKPQFSDKRVRQALTYLMPRRQIAEQIYYNLADVICSPVLPNTDYYNDSLECREHDPVKARALLAEAGWIDSDGDGILDKNGVPFRFEMLVVAGSNVYEQIATIYKEELERAGIAMGIRKLDWAAFLQPIQNHEFDACMLGWSLGIEPDPYQLWHSSGADKPGSSNFVGFRSEKADRIIEEYRVTFDKDVRIDLLRQFQEIVYEEQPYTFLFIRRAPLAIHHRIVNIHFYPVRPSYDLREWYVPVGEVRYGEATP